MKRVFEIILALLCIITPIFMISCDENENRDYNEAELFAAAEKLIEESKPLNDVFYGKGVEYDNLSAASYGNYKQALIFDLEGYGFHSLEELKTLTKKVFTKDYSENIFKTTLESIKDEDDNIRYFARYIEVGDEIGDTDGIIYVNTTYKSLFEGEIEYDYSTLRVVEVKGEKIVVSLKATITTADGKVQSTDKKITLIEEENGWRIDSPSYIVYNEYRDRYEELDKELE